MDMETKRKIEDLEKRLKLLESVLEVQHGRVTLKSQVSLDIKCMGEVTVQGAMIKLN